MVLSRSIRASHTPGGAIRTPGGGRPNPLDPGHPPWLRESCRWEAGAMSETDLEEIDMSAKSSANPSLAARAGRWSAQHRKKAIWGWLAFALIAFMIGGAIGTKTQTNAQSGVGESGRAARTVDNAFPKHQVEEILVQSNSATASDRSFRAVVGDVQRRLAAVPYTKRIREPL